MFFKQFDYQNLDTVVLPAVRDLLIHAAQYTEHLAVMEARMRAARFRMEGEDYREMVQELDMDRRVKHEALLAAIAIACRTYYRATGKPLAAVTTAINDISDRYEVAEWAVAATEAGALAQLKGGGRAS